MLTTSEDRRAVRLGEMVGAERRDLASCSRPAREARCLAHTLLAGRGSEDEICEVALVVDEIVANAAAHGGGVGMMEWEFFEEGAVVGVLDPGVWRGPLPGAASPGSGDATVEAPLAESGRGLTLIAGFTTWWTVREVTSGTLVLAAFRLTGGSR
ncbi:ATP-binding protein [Streptomyces sp. NPDC000594]|uniref:ATP-binding protein n=1 Tax=Streptomyces sp. NPDC000594 TaxID=3154261 RepID=UPI0033321E9E